MGSRGVVGRGVVACVVLAGCGADAPPLSDVTIDRSTDVPVVSFTDLPSVNAPRLRARRVFRTDPDATVLVNVRAGRFLRDGSLLVANLGTSDLVVIDGEGRERRRVGRSGEGPGEYRWPSWVQVAGDVAFVYDRGLRRLTALDGDLTVIRTRQLESDDELIPLAPLAAFGDTVFAIHGESGHVRSSGELRDTTPLLRLVSENPHDTLGLWPGEERAFATVSQGRLVVPIVFGRTAVGAGGATRLAIASTDSLSIAVFDPAGLVRMRFSATGDAPPAAEAVVEQYRLDLLDRLPLETPDTRQAWSSGPARSTIPLLGAVQMDRQDRLWAAPPVQPGDTERLWVGFGRDGIPVGRLTLPTQFRAWPRTVDLLDIAGNRAALHFYGDYDEEYIEVWEWEEGAGP